MVEIAAVTGPLFELAVVAAAAGLGRAALVASVEEAVLVGDPRRAARPRARVSLHARARSPRDLRRHPARAPAGAPPARRRSARTSHAADPTASCPSSPITSRSPPRSPASGAASSTTCARRRPRPRRGAPTRRPHGSRALELGIGDHTRASATFRSSSATSSTTPAGRRTRGDPLPQPGRRNQPRGARRRDARSCTGARQPAAAPPRGQAGGDACRSPKRPSNLRAARRPRGLAAASTCSDRRSSAKDEATNSPPASGRSPTPTPPATKSYGDGHRGDGAVALQRPRPSTRRSRRRGASAAGRDDPVLDAGLRRCLALLLAMAGRFDEALVHLPRATRSSIHRTSRRSRCSTRTATSAQAKVLAGDLAGAKQECSPCSSTCATREVRDRRRERCGPPPRSHSSAATSATGTRPPNTWRTAATSIGPSHRGEALRLPPPRRQGASGRAPRRLAEALELARRAVELGRRSDSLKHRARAWLALAEVQRANGQTAKADAAVAPPFALYHAKGNVAAAAQVRRQFRLTMPSAEGRS